ncbi:MAG: hypothetical protein EPO28_10220 [Saprospiraceae bacterium]|nr:MAG: hypothetical protein EPO28_10220 [Saprospiraceae bacterium]
MPRKSKSSRGQMDAFNVEDALHTAPLASLPSASPWMPAGRRLQRRDTYRARTCSTSDAAPATGYQAEGDSTTTTTRRSGKPSRR